MNTNNLKKFAQSARRKLISQVSSRLDFVLHNDTAELRAKVENINKIKRELGIKDSGLNNTQSQSQIPNPKLQPFIEKIAYIWFNRIMALRFMDANNYTNIKVVSPVNNHTLPEILEEFKKGNYDDNLNLDIAYLNDLQDGVIPSNNPQNEIYKKLLIAVCNSYNHSMPFMFEEIEDYTELLMPEDLLSESSIINDFIAEIADNDCKEVEVIGWLYQFYISEKKDEAFAGLKNNKKITEDNIPAATQLFTPNWIVRYMVENSLGKLWMLNFPESQLIDTMEYYIKDLELGTGDLEGNFNPEFPIQIPNPESIKICDPACGSGHILVYAFDLLYQIYEEEGYNQNEIPKLILENNLHGIEIDERAGALAAFALTMKAREKYNRFLRKPVTPKICVLENIELGIGDLDSELGENWKKTLGIEKLQISSDEDLLHDLHIFENAKNLGSLLQPKLPSEDLDNIINTISGKNNDLDLFQNELKNKALKALKQSDYLSPKYHCVIANPPYLGGKGMNPELAKFAKDNYPDSKSDLFAMFIERGFEMILPSAYSAMVTMQSWMFLSSYEKLRKKILEEKTISSMAHLGAKAFDTIGGEVVQTTTFVLQNVHYTNYKGAFIRLVDGKSEAEKSEMFKEAIK